LLRRSRRSRRSGCVGAPVPFLALRRHRDPPGPRPEGRLEVSDPGEAARAAERSARESYGRLVAFLAARTRDVAGAEDALGEAFAAALRLWPVDGVPDNPDAWLLTVARRRQTDAARRRRTRTTGEAHVKLIAEEIEEAAA